MRIGALQGVSWAGRIKPTAHRIAATAMLGGNPRKTREARVRWMQLSRRTPVAQGSCARSKLEVYRRGSRS